MIAYRFVPEAERELDDVLQYYEEQRAGLGIDFLNAVAQAIDRARRLPQAGTRIAGLSKSSEVRRYFLLRFPYKLVAVVRASELVIVAVARQGRHADYWKSRLAKVRT